MGEFMVGERVALRSIPCGQTGRVAMVGQTGVLVVWPNGYSETYNADELERVAVYSDPYGGPGVYDCWPNGGL